MAFSLEYYDRVIALESDITLLDSLDELFLLPQTPIAMPRAYWTDSKPWPLSTSLMVIKPSLKEFKAFETRIDEGGDSDLVKVHRFDMEILNERFEQSALVLPHRPYALRTAEFRNHDHSDYMGDRCHHRGSYTLKRGQRRCSPIVEAVMRGPVQRDGYGRACTMTSGIGGETYAGC
jgi:hypothetical protein